MVRNLNQLGVLRGGVPSAPRGTGLPPGVRMLDQVPVLRGGVPGTPAAPPAPPPQAAPTPKPTPRPALPGQRAGKGGGPPGRGSSAGKGGQDPSKGLSGRLAGQVQSVLDQQAKAEASRRKAHATRTKRLGEVDQLFKGREGFYDQVFQSVFDQGKRKADEWDRDMQRGNRFAMLGKGLAGGSADVETQSRQRRALGDVMGQVGQQARGARRGARAQDMALRDRMRAGVMSGTPWQGAGAYKPYLPNLPDFQGANRKHWSDMLSGLGAGGMFS